MKLDGNMFRLNKAACQLSSQTSWPMKYEYRLRISKYPLLFNLHNINLTYWRVEGVLSTLHISAQNV